MDLYWINDGTDFMLANLTPRLLVFVYYALSHHAP
jgi:hypothetical protein